MTSLSALSCLDRSLKTNEDRQRDIHQGKALLSGSMSSGSTSSSSGYGGQSRCRVSAKASSSGQSSQGVSSSMTEDEESDESSSSPTLSSKAEDIVRRHRAADLTTGPLAIEEHGKSELIRLRLELEEASATVRRLEGTLSRLKVENMRLRQLEEIWPAVSQQRILARSKASSSARAINPKTVYEEVQDLASVRLVMKCT